MEKSALMWQYGRENLAKPLVRNLFYSIYEKFITKPLGRNLVSKVKNGCCETFSTEPFLAAINEGYSPNHMYETLVCLFQQGVFSKPSFRNFFHEFLKLVPHDIPIFTEP